MAIDTTSPRSRRALLAAGLGAGAATIASALGRPLPARAADGDAIQVGHSYTASTVTKIDTSAIPSGVIALWGKSDSMYGVAGSSASNDGVHGTSDSGTGVLGQSYSGIGVWGGSSVHWGVFGQSTSGYGVHGQSVGHIGVYGTSESSQGVKGFSNSNTGVHGLSSSSDGVKGVSDSGAGVRGVSTSGIGVISESWSASQPAILGTSSGANTGVQGYSGLLGTAPVSPAKTGVYGHAAQDATAVGVKGESSVGTGVLATATTGTALKVAGKAKFSRSGKATVLKTRTYTDITVAGGLTSRSVVHATLQTYRSGVAIAAVRLNYPNTGKARIYLTKVASTTGSTYVGWFVAEY